jgi:hypothetical protein
MDRQKAMIRLEVAAIRWSDAASKDSDGSDDGNPLVEALTELQEAADSYAKKVSPEFKAQLLKEGA